MNDSFTILFVASGINDLALALIVLFVTFWLVQFYFVYRQNKMINKEIRRLQTAHKQGHLGVGISRAKFNFGSGVLMMVVTDLDGIISEVSMIKGISNFAPFKDQPQYKGLSVSEAHQQMTSKKVKTAFENAIEKINVARKTNDYPALNIS